MFKDLEDKWKDEAKRSSRWTAYRVWIGVGLAWLVVLILYFEKRFR